MSLIQVVLVVAFVFLLLRLLADPSSYQIKAWKKIIGIVFVMLAIFAVIFPNILNDFAHFLGVGRGADLLLYLLTLAFIFVGFSQYVSSRQEQKKFVKLARKVALLDADNEHNRNLRKKS